MTIVQKTIGNTTYYTDGMNFYTFHVVMSKNDELWKFACIDLGIPGKPFSSEQEKRINDLAGTGMYQKTKYLLLKNGQVGPVPYNLSVPNIHPGDIILRQVPAPTASTVKCPHCATSVLPGPTCSACGKPLS
jgi:hypothetical protein